MKRQKHAFAVVINLALTCFLVAAVPSAACASAHAEADTVVAAAISADTTGIATASTETAAATSITSSTDANTETLTATSTEGSIAVNAATSTEASTNTAATTGCQDSHKVSSALLAQAQERLANSMQLSLPLSTNLSTNLNTSLSASSSVFPAGDALGVATTGAARAAVIRVSFPASEDGTEQAQLIPENETDADLLAAFNGPQNAASAAYPYESLHAYYERSSFGKLDYQAALLVRYTALHPRSYYEESEGNALLLEALTNLDPNVDFSQCDANNDGYIDAVYLQFAGSCGAWGSTWWPAKTKHSPDSQLGQITLDGKHVCSTVKVSTRACDPGVFEQTLIHETGHVLGLPDLYSYTVPRGPGTGTFDMMENNLGEQNGLFKWLLGWITPEDIAYVHTSSSGVDVRVGTGRVTHYDSAASVNLSAYTTNTTQETGGFIAVSADESILSGNLFCSFYLLQFDHAAGNQTVTISGEPLVGHGIRAFRVQAALNDQGTDFAKSNTSGSAGNQLFEILDPREGGAAIEIGSFLHEGTLVSPTTLPSSNFGGSQEAGYSGITFEILSENETSAQVQFSWTARSEQRSFELVPTNGTSINGFNTLSFAPTWNAPTLFAADEAIELVVDGKHYSSQDAIRHFRCYYDGETLYATIFFNPEDLSTSSTAELVIPQGLFDLGVSETGSKMLSDEMHIPLHIENLTPIDASGTYESALVHYLDNPVTTDVLSDQNGECYFFQATGNTDTHEKTLQLLRISSNGQNAEALQIDARALASSEQGVLVQAIDLRDGTAFLHSAATQGSEILEGGAYGRNAWIDISSGQVLAVRDCDQSEASVEYFALGNAVAFRSFTSDRNPSFTVLQCINKAVVETKVQVKLPAEMSFSSSSGNAGNELVYVASNGMYDAEGNGTVSLYRSEDVLSGENEAASVALFTVPQNFEIYDVKVSNGKVYIACNTLVDSSLLIKKRQLFVYSLEGELLNTVDITRAPSAAAQLNISSQGVVAWMAHTTNAHSLLGSTSEGQIVFIDLANNTQTERGVSGQSCGEWLANRWLEVGSDANNAAEGENPALRRHWSLTCEMGKTNSDAAPSDSSANSDGDAAPSTNSEVEAHTLLLPAAGDTLPAQTLVFALIVEAIVAALLCCSFKRS